MKVQLVSIAAIASCAVASAQDYGRVLSSTPVIQQIAVPQQFCQQQLVAVPLQRHGAGAAVGAIAGAAIGSSIGHGGGRAVGTIIGIVGGAIIGDQIEGPGTYQTQQVQRCTTHTVYENRLLHYNVVYEYAGRQYVVQMPQDPGPTVQLQIAPVSSAPAPVAAAPGMTTIYSTVDYQSYVLPVHTAPVYIGLPAVSLGFGHRHYQQPGRIEQRYPRHRGRGERTHWR